MQAQGPPSGVAADEGYPLVDRTKGPKPAWVENMRLDSDESCLAQRYRSAPYANVGPAMMGSIPAAEKISDFCKENRRRKSLRDFINDIWIKGDNYGWNDKQVLS